MGDIADIMGGSVAPHASDRQDAGLLPAGWYTVEIEKAELRPTKAGDGRYLWLQLSVVSESYTGRKVFPRINLQNRNQKAVEIGQRELAALVHATKLTALEDTAELLGKVIDVRVKVRAAKGDFDASNEVGEYAPAGTKVGAAAPAAAPPPPVAAQARAAAPAQSKAAGRKLPWEK